MSFIASIFLTPCFYFRNLELSLSIYSLLCSRDGQMPSAIEKTSSEEVLSQEVVSNDIETTPPSPPSPPVARQVSPLKTPIKPQSDRPLAPFETVAFSKLLVPNVVLQMLEYRVSVDMIKPSSMNKAKQINRFKHLLEFVHRFVSKDEKKFLDLKFVPPEGPANIQARNLFFKKTLSVVKEACLAINKEYLPRFDEVQRREHNKNQVERQVRGLKATKYKEKKTYRLEVGTMWKMIEVVHTDDAKRGVAQPSTTVTGHFPVIGRLRSTKRSNNGNN